MNSAPEQGISQACETKCPNCGRVMRVPPGSGTKNIGCKACRHCYSYNYVTGSMLPLGRMEPPSSDSSGGDNRNGVASHWRAFAIGSLVLVAVLIGFVIYLLYLAPAPSINLLSGADAAPRTTLEEIQRQLKALTD